MGHKLQMYENLQDMLDQEVAEIERKGSLDKESLDNLYKLSMSMKAVDKRIDREKREEEMKKGQSMDYSYAPNSYARYRYTRDGHNMDSYDGMSNNYYDGGSYDNYNDGMSNARRGRDGDGDGRYNESSRDNFRDNSYRRGRSYTDGNSYEYSREASKKKMVQKLETLMDDTMSEKERNAIKDCIMEIQ